MFRKNMDEVATSATVRNQATDSTRRAAVMFAVFGSALLTISIVGLVVL